MRKVLLLLSMGVFALQAPADVVTFLAADALSCPLLEKPQGKVVVLPEGFYFETPAERVPEQLVKKSVASDDVMISGSIGAAEKMTSYVTSGGFRWYLQQALTFTPAAGKSITKIRVRTQTEAQTKPIPGFETAAANALLQVWNGNSSEPLLIESTNGQNRCFWIEVTTEGTSSQVAMPVCTASYPAVGVNEDIRFECATPGATIHYTTDGSEPTVDSPVYSSPFRLSDDAVIRAIAVKDGLTQSFPSYGEYFVVPAGLSVAKYDFSDWKSLEKSDGTHYTDANLKYAGKNISLVINGVTFVSDGTTFTTTSTAEPKKNYLYQSATFGGMVEYRTAKESTVKITSQNGDIECVVVAGSILTDVTAGDAEAGTFELSRYNTSMAKWTPLAGKGGREMSLFATKNNQYFDQVYVYYKDASGVDGIEVDVIDENLPVEYYNLQGVRVQNPSEGIYIKRQGDKAVKVYIK